MPEPGFLRAVEVLTDALLTPQEFARHKPSPDQMTLRWVTIHPHGDGEEGRRIQINTETGEIEKGFGAGKTMHEAFAPKSVAASDSRKAHEMTAEEYRQHSNHSFATENGIDPGEMEESYPQGSRDSEHREAVFAAAASGERIPDNVLDSDESLRDKIIHDFPATHGDYLPPEIRNRKSEFTPVGLPSLPDNPPPPLTPTQNRRKIKEDKGKESSRHWGNVLRGRGQAIDASEEDGEPESPSLPPEIAAKYPSLAETQKESAKDRANRMIFEQSVNAVFNNYGDTGFVQGDASTAKRIADKFGAKLFDAEAEFQKQLREASDAAGAKWDAVQRAMVSEDPELRRKAGVLCNRAWKKVADQINGDTGKLVIHGMDDVVNQPGLADATGSILGAGFRGNNRPDESAIIVSGKGVGVPPGRRQIVEHDQEKSAAWDSLQESIEKQRMEKEAAEAPKREQERQKKEADESARQAKEKDEADRSEAARQKVHSELMDTVDKMKPGKDFVPPKTITKKFRKELETSIALASDNRNPEMLKEAADRWIAKFATQKSPEAAIAEKYPSLAEPEPDPSKMSLADKLAWQKANPGKGRIKSPEVKPKPKQMASVSGAKYEFVKDNGDGTATVRNEQGDEFSTDPGEPWSLDAPEKSGQVSPSPEKSAGGLVSDDTLFKRTGQQFEEIQKSLGIKNPKMGKPGADAVRKALASRPGGPVIAELLRLHEDHPDLFQRHGFTSPTEAALSAIDGKFTKDQLIDASRWAASHESGDISRFMRDHIRAASGSDGRPDSAEHSAASAAGGVDRLSKSHGKDQAKSLKSEADGLMASSKKPFKPEGVPGEQMGLFDQDTGGQKSLFNIVKPDKKSKKASAAAPSELEKIGDEHKARSEESAPLPGQKSIRGLATKPKNTAEADEKIASQKMASDFLQESRDEKEQAKRKERVSQWRSGFTGSPKENNASGDIARHDWEKALQNGVSPKRLSEMVDSAVQAGALDAGVGKHLKSRFSIEDQYPSLKGFAGDRPESIESPSDLLEKAQEYTEYGENYSRNIATSANRLQSLIDRGHSVQQIRMAADELATRLKVHGDDSQDSKPDSQGNDDPLSIESLKSDISAIEDSIKVHDAKIAAHLRDGRSKGYWDNEDDESAYHKANSERQKAIKDLNDKKTELQKGIESTPEFQKKRQAALDAARRKDNKSERNITSTTYENAMARQSRDFNARYNNRADAMLPARSLDNTFNSDGSVNHESFREDRTTGQSTSPQDESKPSDHAIDPLDIGKHNITEVLENQKADILKSDPKLSPNAAASLAGARVFNALNGRAEEFRRGIDDRVRKGEEISDDEDAKYIAAGDARRNLHSDIVQHTGYRPMGEVDGHPEANKPLVGKANEQEQPTAPQSNPQDELKRHNEEFAAFQEKSIPVFQQEMAMRKELRALFDEPPSKERDKQTRSLQKKLDKVVAAAEEYRKKGDELRERGDSLVAQVRGQQFSRKAPHEELIHHLHEAMNHDGKCCYEKEEGEDDIADHVPADHRHMDKAVHELCRHLGASHPELQAAYENYTAAME